MTTSTDPFDDLRQALRRPMVPTSDSFLNQLLALQPDTMKLSPQQRAAERGAKTETRRLEREFYRVGKGEEWESYAKSGGKNTGVFGRLDYSLEDVVTPVFDLLSVGQYTTAGAIQEMLRTGSAWEGLRQAGIEFSDSLPGVEWEGARKPSYRDIFKDYRQSNWMTWTAGTVLDILADPVNLVPGMAIAGGMRKAGAAGLKASGPLGKSFARKFLAMHAVKTEAPAFMKHFRKFAAQQENAPFEVENAMDALVGTLKPSELYVLGAFQDSENLWKYLDNAVSVGMIDAERVPNLIQTSVELWKVARRQWSELQDHGLVVPSMEKLYYTFHTGATLGGRQWRAQRKFLEKNFPHLAERMEEFPTGGVGRVEEALDPGVMPALKERTYDTLWDRVMAMTKGDLGRTTELNIRSIVTKRSVMQERWLAYRELEEGVMSDKNIAWALDESALGGVAEEVFGNPIGWNRLKRDLLKEWEPQGYTIWEVVDKTEAGSVVRGAYRVPQAVADVLGRADKAFRGHDEVSEFLQAFSELTNVWKGWATVGTAYNMRNMISSAVTSWIHGVGSSYKMGDILDKGFPFPGKGFSLKYLQGLKVQMHALRAGRMPQKAKAATEAIMRKLGIEDWDSIPLPKVLDDNGRLAGSWDEMARLGEDWGVPQTASRVYDLPAGVEKKIWEDLDLTVPMGASDDLKLLGELSGQGMGSSFADKMRRIVGNENPLLKLNRAWAQMIENQARWATWFDAAEKGMSPYEAAEFVKTVHFDYRFLTGFEKRFMRNLLPFYAWQRFNLPRQIMAMVENPGRYAKIPKLKAALESLAPEGWGEIPTPDYFDEVQAMQTGELIRDRPLFVQLDLPHMDLNRLGTRDLMSAMHPLVGVTQFMPRVGYSYFKDAPIENFPGERSEGLPFISKRTEAKVEAAMPFLGKFTRGARAYKRGELPEYLASELAGIKFRALDVRRIMRARTLQRRTLAREFRKRLEQESGIGL